MKIQIGNGNGNTSLFSKYLEIGKKLYENNKNWEVTKIEECGWK